MEKFDIYKDMVNRTNGDIYIGVVGPVRTGKSTFITNFMNKLVIPNIANKLQQKIATDEMPQSADGKTVMTTQPKFVPANAVKVQFKNKCSANIRLVDCVGYFVDGAIGDIEDDKPRLVKTPWSDEKIPFNKAAEIGTKKVIDEYSTIGIVITTDGSFGELKRENYVLPEEKVIEDLKRTKKPFVIVLNSAVPQDDNTLKLADELEAKYGVSVVTVSCQNITGEDISNILEKVLLEFPICGFNVEIPDWIRALDTSSVYVEELIASLKENSVQLKKMRDYTMLDDCLVNSENYLTPKLKELNLSTGMPTFSIDAKDGLFYKVLSSEADDEILDDLSLLTFIKSFSKEKKHYLKIKDALSSAEENGYGIVVPSEDELTLEKPTLYKNGGKYGVKLKVSAPSLHIMKVDVKTEVSPIVGNEKQGEDMVEFLNSQYENNMEGIWQTNMFGKSLSEIVNDDLNGKISSMPLEAQGKMRKTVSRIVNENRGGVICILL